jgi:putative endonuclease
MRNQTLGAAGEDAVFHYIQARGYTVLDRNWRIKSGELDLVAFSPEQKITFIEVKSRSSRKFGDPLEAISSEKAHRLQKLALAWLVMHGLWGSDYHIDCAGVIFSGDGRYEIDYRKGVL